MAHSAEQSHLVETTHRKGFRLQEHISLSPDTFLRDFGP